MMCKSAASPRVWVIVFWIAVAATLMVVFTQGWILPSPDSRFLILDKSDKHLDEIGGYIAVAVTSVDHILSMLMTIQVGVFVLVGFILQKFANYGTSIPRTEIVVGLIFLLCSIISVYFGYIARLEAFELVNSASKEFKSLRPFIGWQALFLFLASVSGICLAALAVFGPPKTTERTNVKDESDDDSECSFREPDPCKVEAQVDVPEEPARNPRANTSKIC